MIITAEGRDLNELLVENGLARIYGMRTALFDGVDSLISRGSLRSNQKLGRRVSAAGTFRLWLLGGPGCRDL